MFKILLIVMLGIILNASANSDGDIAHKVELQHQLQKSMINGNISIKELDHYCHSVIALSADSDAFTKTKEICLDHRYSNVSSDVTLRNMHAAMMVEIAQFNPNRSKVKTRSVSSAMAQSQDYADYLPPAGTPSATLQSNAQSATVWLWSENNVAFMRFEPTGQHFYVDPYAFVFMQDGAQTSSPSFIRVNQSFSGNIYAARTFMLRGGPCPALGFTADLGGTTLSYTPTTEDASACQSGGTCTDNLPPEGTASTTIADYNSNEADIYAWSDGTKSYVRVAPKGDSFNFDRWYFPAMQYGMSSDANFYNCGNYFYSGTLSEAKTFSVEYPYGGDNPFAFDPTKKWSLYSSYDYNNAPTFIATLNPSADTPPSSGSYDIYVDKTVPQSGVDSVIVNEGSWNEANLSLWSEDNVAYFNITPKNSLVRVGFWGMDMTQFQYSDHSYLYPSSYSYAYADYYSQSRTFKLDRPWGCIPFDPTVTATLTSDYPVFALDYTPTTPSGNGPTFGANFIGDKQPPEGTTPVDFVSNYGNETTQLYLWSEANVPYLRVVPESGKEFLWDTYNFLDHIQHNLKLSGGSIYGAMCDASKSSQIWFKQAATIRLESPESNYYHNDPELNPNYPFTIQGNGREFPPETTITYTPSNPSSATPLQATLPPADAQTLTSGDTTYKFWNDPKAGLLVRMSNSATPGEINFPSIDLVQNSRTILSRYTTRLEDEGNGIYNASDIRGAVTLRLFTKNYADYLLDTKQTTHVYNTTDTDNTTYPSFDIDGKGGLSPSLIMYLLN